MSATSHPESRFDDIDGLLACPSCDMLLNDRNVAANEIAACPRCHTVIEAPRPLAMTRIIMMSFAALILLFAALFFPFLELQAVGMMRHTTLLDTIAAFSDGLTAPLTLLMGALIVFLPLIRFVAIVYVLAPMAFGWEPLKHAIPVFRLAEAIRPWAMVEIFMVGVAVALVKVAGLAQVTIGPAFWAFVALVIVTVFKDNFMSRVTVWKTLETRRLS